MHSQSILACYSQAYVERSFQVGLSVLELEMQSIAVIY